MHNDRRRILIILFGILLLAGNRLSGQGLYDISKIQKVEIFFSQANWDYRMDTAKSGHDGYILSDSVRVNGIVFDSVGVKYKGNSSYNSAYSKNPMHISLNEFKGQSYEGYKDIKLGNGYADPSMIREVLSYSILQNYMDCPKSNFATLFINGSYIGVYSNAESINKKFTSDHFSTEDNTQFKCNPVLSPGPNTKSNLKYIDNDSASYYNFYELKSDLGWKELVALCDSVTNKQSNLPSILDWDRVLWMLAFNNAAVNLDSYSGVFAQNYYLYKDNTGRYVPIVWDLNMSLGGFPFLGSSNTSMGSLTITNLQQLPTNIHATDNYWPLINAVHNDPVWKRKYIAHLKTIMAENFTNGAYQTLATQYRTLIDSAVGADANKFYTTTQYQNSMTTSTVVGSYSVPGIKSLMDARVAYLSATGEFTATAPVITNITIPSVNLHSDASITATIQNASAATLSYRFSANEVFGSVAMYDDGNHGDGAAGDKVYGGQFNMSGAQAQFYIYADNSNAGKFSPERAEHEFYTVNAIFSTAKAGEVKINEFLALNQNDTVDEAGQHEDWIELYNTTADPLNLFGLYLTDGSNLTKYAFPPGTIIQPHNFLVLFADQDSSTPQFLHCNFKLSGNGERLMLSDGIGGISDSITYFSQAADVSIGRCPNGTGPFAPTTKATFGKTNCSLGVIQVIPASQPFRVYPNPATNYFQIAGAEICSITVYNALGKEVFHEDHDQPVTEVHIDNCTWNPGMYLVRINESVIMRLQVLK
jgi:hypothetical protein